MSATEKLRALLDERGVEWTQSMAWNVTVINGDWLVVEDVDFGTLSVSTTAYQLTPEQAIAATLGGGRLTAEQVRDVFLGNFEKAHETSYDLWEPSRFNWQAIADELNAVLGDGDCELEETDYCYAGEVRVIECSACGRTCEHANGSYEYCPHCGRKAVER